MKSLKTKTNAVISEIKQCLASVSDKQTQKLINEIILAQRDGTKLDALQTFLADFKLLKIIYKNKLRDRNQEQQKMVLILMKLNMTTKQYLMKKQKVKRNKKN